jgi:hypothetical protein
MARPWLAPLLAPILCACGDASGAPKLVYGSVESEAASEFQSGDGQFGPSYLRLIGRAELALTESLTAKAVVSPCGGPYSAQPKGVTECSPKRLIEELTLGGVYEGFDFSVGRQIVTQGNTEGFILLDRYNGRDFCRFARLDVQNKLPNWIARGRAFSGPLTFAATFAPFSANSRLPAPGSYCDDAFHDPGRFDRFSDPENDRLEDWAGGGEFAVTRDSWSAALNLMSTREDIFVLKTVPLPEKTRPRTLWLGGTASATFGGIVLRGEVAFAPERAFTLDPAALGGLFLRGIQTNGVDERWNLLASVGVEGRNDDWYWALQYFHDRVENGPALTRDAEAHFASLRIRKSFLNDRVTLDSFAVMDISYSDLGIRASVSYEFDEETKVEVGGTAYADMGNDPGLLGNYAGRESLFVKLRRTLF